MAVLVELLVLTEPVLEITARWGLFRLRVKELHALRIAGVGLRLLIWGNKWRGLECRTILFFLDEIIDRLLDDVQREVPGHFHKLGVDVLLDRVDLLAILIGKHRRRNGAAVR